MLDIHDLHYSYEETKILDGLTLNLAKGEIVALIGVSGSGKTTLFRLITGLLHPDQGSIRIGQKPLPDGARYTTYMQQEDLLLPWRTIMRNLLLFTELGEWSKKTPNLEEAARQLLKRVGLPHSANAYPHELSGGMRQRVSLARALLQDQPLLLLDEPFGSLDVVIREQLFTLLQEIREEHLKTVLLVTHDFRDAITLVDRIVVLVGGKIVKSYADVALRREDPCQVEQLMQEIRQVLSGSVPATL